MLSLKEEQEEKSIGCLRCFTLIFLTVLIVLDKVLGTTFNLDRHSWRGALVVALVGGDGWLEVIYAWVLFVPYLAVSFRRLHDVDKSGWWNLLFLVPLAGWIILLVWNCRESQVGENKYEGNPKDRQIFI
ncbi:MAG: DUF805 domain-containing protein [Bacteroidales bacterium]|nr:DUF805 domain-containing protein [Bacteroidales bacterium]MCL2738792.1 DUF805 domain-containing protein [Bacteroidales bacterium]